MGPSLAANDPVAAYRPIRVEQCAVVRGRPAVILAWFAAPEPEVGLPRPQLVAALAVDVDGEVYEDLDPKDQLGPVIEQLRARAAQLLEG